MAYTKITLQVFHVARTKNTLYQAIPFTLVKVPILTGHTARQ